MARHGMMEAWQVTRTLLKETWWPKALGRNFDIKSFKTMLATIHKTLGDGRGIRYKNTVEAYDEVILLYKQTLVDYCNSVSATLDRGTRTHNPTPTNTNTCRESSRNRHLPGPKAQAQAAASSPRPRPSLQL